jgi:hypothetical protein
MDLNDIASRVSTCLVLHNILVADRIMDGDYKARYDPAASVVLKDEDQEDELLPSQNYDTRPPSYCRDTDWHHWQCSNCCERPCCLLGKQGSTN